MEQDGFALASSAFLAEFKSQPKAQFHPSISLCDLRSSNRGRGILATSDIPADTELFTIPRSYIISVENSRLVEAIPQIFEDVELDDEGDEIEEMPRSWLNLILVMTHDYLNQETSRWRAYWSVLPTLDSFDTLMFWDEGELSELQGSAVRGRIGKAKADKMFKTRILPVIERHRSVFYPEGSTRLGEEDMLKIAHRMGSLIMAYAFDLENEQHIDEEDEGEDGWAEDRESQMVMGMVPMADMLNADAEFNAHLEHGEETLTMRSLREIKAGEEVLNYYGPLPNCDLARRYGYTSKLHARHDVVEISWSLIEKFLQRRFPGKDLQSSLEEDDIEDTFVFEREAGEPDGTGKHTSEAKFINFPEELTEQVNVFAATGLDIDTSKSLSVKNKKKLKRTVLEIIKTAITARSAEYDTTLEQDQQILHNPNLRPRMRMAIDVRLGEKQVLKEADDLASKLIAKYTDTDTGGANGANKSIDGRATKKQKTR